MTTEEIKNKLKTEDDKWESFVPYEEVKQIIGGLEVEPISSKRGATGDHDTYEFIFKIDNRLFRLNGYYHSDSGVDFYNYYDFNECRPVEKVVTVYEKIK